MTLVELGDVMQAQLVIRSRLGLGDAKWYAAFEHADVKDGDFLVGVHGNGSSPHAALSDYIDRIAGKTMVFSAGIERRREIFVPDSLSEIGD